MGCWPFPSPLACSCAGVPLCQHGEFVYSKVKQAIIEFSPQTGKPAHHKDSSRQSKRGAMRSGHDQPLRKTLMVGNHHQHKEWISQLASGSLLALPLFTLPLFPSHHFPYPTLHSSPRPSLTFLPHNLPLPPFPLAFSTFPFSLLAPLHFKDLLDVARTHHVILASLYILRPFIQANIPTCGKPSRITRNPGVKPPQPADAGYARVWDSPGAVSTHLLHPQLTLCSQSQEKNCF